MPVTLIVGWGTPMFAMPSAGPLTLILDLIAFGFVAAFGISVGIAIPIRRIRGQVQSWVNELRNPEHWQPGCVAIEEQ
jgi:hypothetical protein